MKATLDAQTRPERRDPGDTLARALLRCKIPLRPGAVGQSVVGDQITVKLSVRLPI